MQKQIDIIEDIRNQHSSIGDWISPLAEVRDSENGRGIFAREPINAGEIIVVWGGDYVDSSKAIAAEKNGKLVMQWDTDLFSVEDRGDSDGYFVNHSCEPNLWMQGAFALVAMRDIKKDEELVADYAMWEADENYVSKWDCKCGSVNCRGKVTGMNYRDPNLQKQYRNHFSPLINKRIEKVGINL